MSLHVEYEVFKNIIDTKRLLFYRFSRITTIRIIDKAIQYYTEEKIEEIKMVAQKELNNKTKLWNRKLQKQIYVCNKNDFCKETQI